MVKQLSALVCQTNSGMMLEFTNEMDTMIVYECVYNMLDGETQMNSEIVGA